MRRAATGIVLLLVVFVVMSSGAATVLAAPGAISGLASPAYSTGSFGFSWNPVAGIAGYAFTFDRSANTSGGTTVSLSPIGFASTQVTVGPAPWQVVTGDFGNGKLDLAAVNEGNSHVRVLLGNGNGAFTVGGAFATGHDPRSIAVGDFNGDGHPDLAVANYFDDTVSVLLASGVATFAPKVDYPTGTDPHGLAVGDLGNGHLDLIVANAVSNTVSVLIGNGDGTFAPKVDYPTGARPEKVVIGDFNGDGHPDLAVVNNADNTVSILLGAGDGTFTAGNTYATGKSPYWLTAGDLGNGKLDLVTANYAGDTASVLLGNGDGTFAPRFDYPAGGQPNCVAITDVNGDGIPDLVVSDHTGSLAVLLGKGNSTFMPAQFITTGSTPRFFTQGDFNGDGSPDLAVPFDSGTTVDALLNTTNSASPTVTETANAEGTWYFHVCAVDVNGNPGPTTTRQVLIDTTPPVTTDNAPSGWQNHAVTVTLTPTDASSGMVGGQAGTWYSLDGAANRAGTSVVVGRNGRHILSYYSKDAAGNAEKAHSVTIEVDTAGPQTRALYQATVKAGKVAKFRFRISDKTPQAQATIVITKKGHVRRMLVIGTRATGTILTVRWKCTLPSGRYRWKVDAVDEAGNPQVSARSNNLIVK
jgi:hypothetical protein